jgi:branched-subunit amino acid aminotransferase/4-amino-4-deoxychorismate lyase
MAGQLPKSSLVRDPQCSTRALTSSDGPIALAPSATVFHYAQCLFEGLKAYRNEQGRITLFRPELNMARMNRSAERIALPVRAHCSC